MSDLSNQEVQNLLKSLQQNLQSDTTGSRSLASELESAAKHLPAYIKIVKSHIEQLRKVLELETHNHRTLENAGLAAPVQQLIRLFNNLKDDDIPMLEELAMTAHSWQASEELAPATATQHSDAYVETAS